MPRFIDLNDFIAQHHELERRLNTYLEMAKSNYQTMDMQQLSMGAQRYMHASNIESRIRFATCVTEAIQRWLAATTPKGLFRFVTLTPVEFAFLENEAGAFDVRVLQNWVRSVLPNVNFLGMVEAGYFPRWPEGHSTISFHAHLIIWGETVRGLRSKLRAVADQHSSLVPGIKCTDNQRVAPEEVPTRFLYALKFPMRQSLPYPLKVKQIGSDGVVTRLPTGRFGIHKPELRTGQMVTMCNVLADQYLDRMLFAGGDGAGLYKHIKKAVMIAYESDKRA